MPMVSASDVNQKQKMKDDSDGDDNKPPMILFVFTGWDKKVTLFCCLSFFSLLLYELYLHFLSTEVLVFTRDSRNCYSAS